MWTFNFYKRRRISSPPQWLSALKKGSAPWRWLYFTGGPSIHLKKGEGVTRSRDIYPYLFRVTWTKYTLSMEDVASRQQPRSLVGNIAETAAHLIVWRLKYPSLEFAYTQINYDNSTGSKFLFYIIVSIWPPFRHDVFALYVTVSRFVHSYSAHVAFSWMLCPWLQIIWRSMGNVVLQLSRNPRRYIYWILYSFLFIM
jgi:hypothetical protein